MRLWSPGVFWREMVDDLKRRVNYIHWNLFGRVARDWERGAVSRLKPLLSFLPRATFGQSSPECVLRVPVPS